MLKFEIIPLSMLHKESEVGGGVVTQMGNKRKFNIIIIIAFEIK